MVLVGGVGRGGGRGVLSDRQEGEGGEGIWAVGGGGGGWAGRG